MATLLLSSCESDERPPEKQAQHADLLRASDVPDGSSGSLVAVVDGEVVTCRGWGESEKDTDTPAGCDTTTAAAVWDAADVAVEYDEGDRSHGRPFDHPWAADGPYWNLRGNGGILSTAHDMGRWLLVLQGDRLLDADAKAELFRPRVLEEPGGGTRYAFGWVVAETSLGTVDWHNGGNGWSYAEIALLPGSRAGLFWVTNHFRSASGGWNFERLRPSLTERVAKRLVAGA